MNASEDTYVTLPLTEYVRLLQSDKTLSEVYDEYPELFETEDEVERF